MAQAVARRARTDQAKQVQAALREMGYRELPLPDGITGRQIEEFAEAFVSAKASVALAGPAGASGPVAILTAIGAAPMNFAAGRFGQTVDSCPRPHALSGATAGEQVGQALDGLGPDDVLIVHNANPAYAISGVPTKSARRARWCTWARSRMKRRNWRTGCCQSTRRWNRGAITIRCRACTG